MDLEALARRFWDTEIDPDLGATGVPEDVRAKMRDRYVKDLLVMLREKQERGHAEVVAAVRMLTGFSDDKIGELGGVPPATVAVDSLDSWQRSVRAEWKDQAAADELGLTGEQRREFLESLGQLRSGQWTRRRAGRQSDDR